MKRVRVHSLVSFVALLLTAMGCSSQRVHQVPSEYSYRHQPDSIINGKGLSATTVAAMREANVRPLGYLARPRAATLRFKEQALLRQPNNFAVQRAFVEQCVGAGRKLEDNNVNESIGFYLRACETALPRVLGRDPESVPLMLDLYNFATSRVAKLISQAEGATQFGALDKSFSLRIASGGNRVSPGTFDSLQPANELKLKGLRQHVTQKGLGAALVGYRETTKERRSLEPNLPIQGLYQPITAVLTFSRINKATLSYYDVMDSDRIQVGGISVTLAADFSGPLASAFDRDPNNSPFAALFRPEKYHAFMGLTLTEPFRRDAIPVVLVHGLASNGSTWDETLNGLLADRTLRDRYQFMLYQYPSGYPFVYSAAKLRKQLRAFRNHYDPGDRLPAMDHFVLVGHSMGGLISSAQIRRVDEQTWNKYLRDPMAMLEVPEETRRELQEMYYLKPEPYIRRAIFVSTPHRGSTIADGWIGRFTSKLIRLPNNVLTLNLSAVVQDVADAGMSLIEAAPNSVTRLRYHNPSLSALVKLPVSEMVIYHSIVGDRGVGNMPESSDGVVSYESSHLEGAASEKVVPARHDSHTHPEAIAEIRRILLEHLKAR